MALFGAYVRIFGNKHNDQETAIKYSLMRAYFIVLLAVGLVMPPQVLAFEAELPYAQSQKFVAVVRLVDQVELVKVKVAANPDYSMRMSGSITTHPSVETKSGDWTNTKLVHTKDTASVYYKSGAPLRRGEPVVLQGEASYYSRAGCLGCNPGRIMANGQPLNDNALTMAIGANLKHLVGRKAKVTNFNTGRAVEVLITDTGGFYQAKYGSRVADLTLAAKQAIGMNGGVGQVKVEVY